MINHKGTKRIETERLILRKFTIDDADDMYNNWANDDLVTEYLTWPTHSSVEVSKMVLDYITASYKNEDTYSWAIFDKEFNEVIGTIGVVDKDDNHEYCTMGYCIGQQYWGKGITTEALKVVIEFLFKEVCYERIQAFFHSTNIASGKVMEKAGMKYEGKLRHYQKDNKGNFVDCDFYGIVRKDYFNSN